MNSRLLLVKFSGSQNYMQIFACRINNLIPCAVQGSTVYKCVYMCMYIYIRMASVEIINKAFVLAKSHLE